MKSFFKNASTAAGALGNWSQSVLPTYTTTMTVTDRTHSEHTKDEDGNYKHPFLGAPEEV